MNRIASALAGTVATVATGAGVVGIANTQGVFDNAPAAVHQAAAESQPAATATTGWTGNGATAAPQATPRVVYVDKQPLVVNQEIRIPAPAGASLDNQAAPDPSPTKPASATPTAQPTAKPAVVTAPPSFKPVVPAVPVAAAPTPAPVVSSPVFQDDDDAAEPPEFEDDDDAFEAPEVEEPEVEAPEPPETEEPEHSGISTPGSPSRGEDDDD